MNSCKVVNWHKFLIDKIDEWQSRKFKWGTNDCCIFVGECCEVMTGFNPMSEFMGRYRSESGANKVLRQVGGIEAVLGRYYNNICLERVQRGDIVFGMAHDGTETVSVWYSGHWSTCEDGVRMISFEPVSAWRV